MLCLLWVKTLIVYSAAVTELMFILSCYIGPRYNGTRLYIKANYNRHSPLKVCLEVSKHWRLLHLVGKVFILTAHIVVMHMLAANNLFAKNLQLFLCGEGIVSSNEMTTPPHPLPSGCVVQHQSNFVCCYSIVQQKLYIICFNQLRDTYSEFLLQIARVSVLFIYRHMSNIRCTKSHNSNVSCLILHLSLGNPLKQGVKSRMKM